MALRMFVGRKNTPEALPTTANRGHGRSRLSPTRVSTAYYTSLGSLSVDYGVKQVKFDQVYGLGH